MKRIAQSVTVTVLIAAMVGGCMPPSSGDELPGEDTLLIFHNGTGPMCLDALNWLATEHPDLPVREYLTTNLSDLALLAQLKTAYGTSQGVSTNFGYLPIIFFGGQAFSGFNDEVKQALTQLIGS